MDLPKDRPMPKDRTTPYAITPHSQTAEVKKPNCLQVDDLIELLSNHKGNPEKWTLDYITSRFDISKERAGNSNEFHSSLTLTVIVFNYISTEKLIANYSTLETHYADAASKSDRYLQYSEPVDRIRPNTSIFEAEDILTKNQKKKWKTISEFRKENKI